jgi:hypothetical protein
VGWLCIKGTQLSYWWDYEFVSSLGFLNFNPWMSVAACLLIDPTLLLGIIFCGSLSCCKNLLMGYILSKLEMQGIDFIFLQMGVMECCAESRGCKYKHTSSSQCFRMKSSIELFFCLQMGYSIILDNYHSHQLMKCTNIPWRMTCFSFPTDFCKGNAMNP